MGNIAFWHYKGDLNSRTENPSNEDSLWELLAPSEVEGPVIDLKVKSFKSCGRSG